MNEPIKPTKLSQWRPRVSLSFFCFSFRSLSGLGKPICFKSAQIDPFYDANGTERRGKASGTAKFQKDAKKVKNDKNSIYAYDGFTRYADQNLHFEY